MGYGAYAVAVDASVIMSVDLQASGVARVGVAKVDITNIGVAMAGVAKVIAAKDEGTVEAGSM